MAAAPTPCPDFDLAPLEAFPKVALLAGRNTPDSFVLVLSLAFNDLKGLIWIIEQLNKHFVVIDARRLR